MGEARDEGDRGRERRKRPPRPLDEPRLSELALAYVARFATSRARLRTYLTRKLRERGWEGEREPDPAALAERLAVQGFIDDRAFAEAKGSSLTRRGYGERRVRAALTASGIEEADRCGALEAANAEAWQSALRFAQRRRIGPFAQAAMDRPAQAKALAAMIRAGHGFDLARRIAAAPPGQVPEPD